MEHANIEIAQLESAVNEAADGQLRELTDLQLAVVGGGSGEVVFV
jgi:predicted negative regulator of RcsB-dependent stress response